MSDALVNEQHWIDRATRSAARARADRVGSVVVEMLPPHASTRRYARVRWVGEGSTTRSEIVQLLPPRGGAVMEAGGAAPAAASEDAFVHAQRWLAGLDQPVPSVFAVDDHDDAVWLEDLGGTDLDRAVTDGPARIETLYTRALDVLVGFTAAASAAPGISATRRFDAALLRWELDHYVEWRLETELGLRVSHASRQAFATEFDALVARVLGMPEVTIHRDYQSHNLMIVGPEQRVVMLDFQDAMRGPLVYDAVALLRDSYVDLPGPVYARLRAAYAHKLVEAGVITAATALELPRWFALQTVQRKLKDAGRFVFIDRVRHNSSFLQWIPVSLRYVRAALDELAPGGELARLDLLLQEHDPALRTPPEA